MTDAPLTAVPDDADAHFEPGVALGEAVVDRRSRRRTTTDRQRGPDGSGSPSTANCSTIPNSAANSSPARGHKLATSLRYRGLGPSLRRSRRGDVLENPRPIRRLDLGSSNADPHSRAIAPASARSITRNTTADSFGPPRSKACSPPAWFDLAPTRKGLIISFYSFVMEPPALFSKGSSRSRPVIISSFRTAASTCGNNLGTRFSRPRPRTPLERSRPARRRAGRLAPPLGRAPLARRRAGRRLHQRRTRFDGRLGHRVLASAAEPCRRSPSASIARAPTNARTQPSRPRSSVRRSPW